MDNLPCFPDEFQFMLKTDAGAAKQWLAENGVRNKPCRFDVVTVLGEEIEHIEGAFDMDDAARGAYAVRKQRG